MRERSAAVRGSGPEEASTELPAATPDGRLAVRAVVAPGSPGIGGAAPVTVRGGPGYSLPASGAESAAIAFLLPSGRWLTLSGTRP